MKPKYFEIVEKNEEREFRKKVIELLEKILKELEDHSDQLSEIESNTDSIRFSVR